MPASLLFKRTAFLFIILTVTATRLSTVGCRLSELILGTNLPNFGKFKNRNIGAEHLPGL